MHERVNLYCAVINKLKAAFFLAFFLCSLLPGNVLHAQNQIPDDSTITRKRIDPATLDSAYHNPRKAAIFSAVVPGLGQVYNKKYWKVPIVFAGFATLGYLVKRNDKDYRLWRQAYIDYGTPEYKSPLPMQLSQDQVNSGKDFYKRQKELSIIATAGFYVLQIIDATVDAYLFEWSVGEDLSLKVEPAINAFPAYTCLTYSNSFGIRACLSF
jgi:hypothetical protein